MIRRHETWMTRGHGGRPEGRRVAVCLMPAGSVPPLTHGPPTVAPYYGAAMRPSTTRAKTSRWPSCRTCLNFCTNARQARLVLKGIQSWKQPCWR
jgi:hypothetical protein